MFFTKVKKRFCVALPEALLTLPLPVKLYGKYIPASGYFNIVGTEKQPGYKYLGVLSETLITDPTQLIGHRINGQISFKYRNKTYQPEYYQLHLNIFSRNQGILETSLMQKKKVMIIGAGSVGSLVALELARAGASTFYLIDLDIIEYHNIARHQCGISDVGKFKVDALKERILDINPSATVITRKRMVETLAQADFDALASIPEDALIIGCGDNRASDAYSNRIAAQYHLPFLSIGLWERAAVGEVFYYLPDQGMPCAGCALGEGLSSGRVDVNNHHVYTNEADLHRVNFQPGISADINFVTTIGIKLALDLLNRKDVGYIPRLLNDLQQYTLICNTNNPELGTVAVEIFSYPLQVTTSLKVQFRKSCGQQCRAERK